MYNVIINDDDEVIGKIEDIERYFRNELVSQLKDYDESLENIRDNFDMFCDTISEIEENEQESINNNCYFKMSYNPMGCYTYSVLKEMK